MAQQSILILNGPGLADLSNFNGTTLTLPDIEQQCNALANRLGFVPDFRQTDDIAELCHWIEHEATRHAALIINPMAYTHATETDSTRLSTALQQLAGLNKPVIEVHTRNTFLEDSSIEHPLQPVGTPIAFIAGLGAHSYLLALRSIQQRLAAEVSA